MSIITRYVNYPITDINPLPNNSFNYLTYSTALSSANNNDRVIVYQNGSIVLNFVFKAPQIVQPTMNNDLSDLTSDNAAKFIYTILEANNNNINDLKLKKNITINYNNNKFRITTMVQNDFISGVNEFRGSKIQLNTNLPQNHKLLVGIADTLNYKNNNQILGFFVKEINATNFNVSDQGSGQQDISIVPITKDNKIKLTIDFPILIDDKTAVEFSERLVNLTKEGYFTKPLNYSVIKNFQKNYTLDVASPNVFLLLEYNRYSEYAINQLSHAFNTNILPQSLINKRSARELYNIGAAPMKGRYNGWRFNKDNNNYINWNLYNYNKDFNISNDNLIYFWVIISQISNESQTIFLEPTDNIMKEASVTTDAITGKHLLWYANTNVLIPPNKNDFSLILDNVSYNVKRFNFESFVTNLKYMNIKTKTENNNKFYLESFGYSTNNRTFNLALKQFYDNTIDELSQIYLSNESGYNTLYNRFINKNPNGVDSSYPMDRFIEDSLTQPDGLYFDSSKNLSLNLLSTQHSNLTFNHFHTIFVEVIIKDGTNFTLSGFSKNSINIDSQGHKLIYFKNSPFVTELPISPPSSFNASIVNNVGNNSINIGSHGYKVTFFSNTGETIPSNAIYVNITIANSQVNLINIPVSTDTRVIGRKIYRTAANESQFKLLYIMNNNTTTTYFDNSLDIILGDIAPTINIDNSNTLTPYFPTLSDNLDNNKIIFTSSTNPINPNDLLNKILFNVGSYSDVELISYGYKIMGELPVHFMTRWESIENNPMIQNIDGYLVIQKDTQIDIEDTTTINDSKFNVKAYGNFIQANYQQNRLNNNYGDIRVNVKLNEAAVANALYYLEASNINNYTINPGGLRYTADAIAIVNENGSTITEDDKLVGVLINNKYIMANFSNNTTLESDYITEQQGQKIFNMNGGINAVILQGVYAALYKEFNKSSAILNSNMIATLNQVASEIKKPQPPLIEFLTTPADNLTLGGLYSYKITYYSSFGETESSIESYGLQQPVGSRNKIKLTLPISDDIRTIGRKIYRKCADISNNQFLFLVSINDNTTINYIDDIPDPLDNLSILPPSLSYLTANDSNYLTTTVARKLELTSSNLTATGSYYYKVSYYTLTGETLLSDASNIITILSSPCKVIVNIPTSNNINVIGRKIYRTLSGTNTFKLLVTINNNTSTVYIDDKPDTDLGVNEPVTTTLNILKPSNPSVLLYDINESNNLTSLGTYLYKFTFVTSNGGETSGSVASNSVTLSNTAYKIFLNIPISSNSNVVARKIYRTYANGNQYKLLTTINNNTSSFYIDDIPDSSLSNLIPNVNTTTQIAPSTNTTSSLSGNSDPVNILLSNSIREVNVPSTSSTLFKLYANSGRLAKDRSVYNTDKRGGTGTNIDDGTVVTDTINMNLENMSINFRCKLRGSIFDITGNKRFNKAQITKDLAEFVFGKYSNSSNGIISEPATMVREVTRTGQNTYGVDENGYKMDMLNNEKNSNGTYIVSKEIQYEIIFKVSLVQKTY